MVKRLNNCIFRVPNGEERENVTEEIFEKVLAVLFFKLMKDTKLEIRKGF